MAKSNVIAETLEGQVLDFVNNGSVEPCVEQKSSESVAPVEATPKEKPLGAYQLHSGSSLKRKGYKFGRLKINRSLNVHALSLKKKSILAVGGVITPLLVVYAKTALDAGLQVVLEDGTEVSDETPELGKILVIVDGQHRRQSVLELNKELSKDERIETYYYFPLVPGAMITTMLREANVATSVWKGGDYLVSAITSAPDDLDTQMLEWIIDHMGSCGDTASWYWATLDKSRLCSKQQIIKASKDVEVLRRIADTEGFENGKMLFEAAKAVLGIDLVKLKVLPEWVIGKMKYLSRYNSSTKAADLLVSFFSTIKKKEAAEIANFKKHGTLSKDHQIEQRLDALFEAFEKKNLKSNNDN